MEAYIILLRGINVGGKNKLPMAGLRKCLEELGFIEISTYIASGNVILKSHRPANKVKDEIESALPRCFKLDSELIKVLVLTQDQLQSIVDHKPAGFGKQPDKFHSDVIFLIGIDAAQALAVFDPREGVDKIWPGTGVIYSQRLSSQRTKSRLGKIVGKPVYKSMTTRSWNTTVKLLEMVKEQYADKEKLKRIGAEFFDTESSNPEELHASLQAQIREVYQDIKHDIDFSNVKSINDSVARIASDSPDTPAIGAWLPTEYKKHEGTKMECTLGSAMVKLALEENGFPDARTAVLKGHQVAIKNNEDGAITIFDPTTTHTIEGQRHGFIATFSVYQVVGLQNVFDEQGKLRGQKFRIETKEKPRYTNMFDGFDNEKDVYYREFFASEPDTLVELSVVLENLDNVKYTKQFDSLKDYNATNFTHNLKIFNHKDLFKK